MVSVKRALALLTIAVIAAVLQPPEDAPRPPPPPPSPASDPPSRSPSPPPTPTLDPPSRSPSPPPTPTPDPPPTPTPPPPSSASLVDAVHASLRAAAPALTGDAPASAPAIAVGVNANLDLVVDALPVLRALGFGAGDDDRAVPARDADDLASLEAFAACFAAHFARGAAGERSFSNATAFDELVRAARVVPGGRRDVHVGGNAGLIAHGAAAAGGRALLGGPVGPQLRRELHPGVVVVGGAERDEVHLILEYAAGARWGGHAAGRANRFIVSADRANAELRGLEAFWTAVPAFAPDAVVLSGVHMLEAVDDARLRAQRLRTAAGGVLQQRVPVHLELASMATAAFAGEVRDALFGTVTSLGLNEQELGLVAPGTDVTDARDVVRALQQLLRPGREAGARRRLRRVHFHSLPFHVVVQHRGASAVFGPPAEAAAAGSATATRLACDGRTDAAAVDAGVAARGFAASGGLEPLGVHAWHVAETDVDVAVAPVLVCRRPVRTVGLGDAISTAGVLALARRAQAAAAAAAA